MYEELVKRLKSSAKWYEYGMIIVPRVCLEAANAIEQLSNAESAYGRGWTLGYDAGREESKPRWVPVTEWLPSVEKEVYVTDGEYIARANLLDEVFPGDKPCWSYSGLGEITHWCEQIPLPQPPKEGE